jgi:hypothetical protein
VIYTFACFRFPARTTRSRTSIVSLIKPLIGFALHSSAGILSWCMLIALIDFSYPQTFILGQTPDITAAPQPGEEINPQYESNVKAAYLYGFARYVKWEDSSFADASSPFILGICGECQFEKALDRLAEVKNIQGRRLVIKKMASIAEVQPCNILFVAHSIPFEQQVTIIKKMSNKAILLVGEAPGFAERGGGINFYLDDKTVRFEINVDAIRREGLTLNAKLLNLGKKLPSTISQQGEVPRPM